MKQDLEYILIELCLPGLSSRKKEQINRKLVKEIIHPSQIAGSVHLPDNHQLKKESIIIRDSFELVTNGMAGCGELERLQEIDMDSPFYAWKALIFIINSLYVNDLKNTLFWGSQIPENHFLYPLYLIILKIQEVPSFDQFHENSLWSSLLDSLLFVPDHLLNDLHFLEETLNEKQEDIFLGSSALLLNDFFQFDEEAAQSLSLWVLNRIQEYDFSLSPFLSQMKRILGTAETMRLTAISTLKEQPDVSLLYWLQYLVEIWRIEAVSEEKVATILSIIGDLGLVLSIEDEDDAFQSTLERKILIAENEIGLTYPHLFSSGEITEKQVLFRKWSSYNPGASQRIEISEIKEAVKECGQLELFLF